MLRHHLRLAITPAQRHRFAATMSLAADDAELPADPEFRAAIIGCLEWGTRLPWRTPSPKPTRSSTHPLHDGAGASRRHTKVDGWLRSASLTTGRNGPLIGMAVSACPDVHVTPGQGSCVERMHGVAREAMVRG